MSCSQMDDVCVCLSLNLSSSTSAQTKPAVKSQRCSPIVCVCVCACSASVQPSVALLFSLSEMCLQSHSARAVLCVPSLARLQMNYICPEVKRRNSCVCLWISSQSYLTQTEGHSTTFMSPLAKGHHVVYETLKNPLHHSRICIQILLRGKILSWSNLFFLFVSFWSFSCTVHYCNLF